MAAIISLRQAGRLEEAASHYSADAALVASPGMILRGRDAVREGFAQMAAAYPWFEITNRIAFENGDVALHHSEWVAQGTHPDETSANGSGRTADVLVREPNGPWMVAIDNPWGTALLGEGKTGSP